MPGEGATRGRKLDSKVFENETNARQCANSNVASHSSSANKSPPFRALGYMLRRSGQIYDKWAACTTPCAHLSDPTLTSTAITAHLTLTLLHHCCRSTFLPFPTLHLIFTFLSLLTLYFCPADLTGTLTRELEAPLLIIPSPPI
jgi:hypothetical protein